MAQKMHTNFGYAHSLRMLSAAKARVADADLLDQSGQAVSNSAAILRVLGLELLLKCLCLLSSVEIDRKVYFSHDYASMWMHLPESVKLCVLEAATVAFPGLTDLSDVEALMKAYQHVFEKGRYFYERHKFSTLDEVSDDGLAWVQSGAKDSDAQLLYHPLELISLVEGCISTIEAQIIQVEQRLLAPS